MNKIIYVSVCSVILQATTLDELASSCTYREGHYKYAYETAQKTPELECQNLADVVTFRYKNIPKKTKDSSAYTLLVDIAWLGCDDARKRKSLRSSAIICRDLGTLISQSHHENELKELPKLPKKMIPITTFEKPYKRPLIRFHDDVYEEVKSVVRDNEIIRIQTAHNTIVLSTKNLQDILFLGTPQEEKCFQLWRNQSEMLRCDF